MQPIIRAVSRTRRLLRKRIFLKINVSKLYGYFSSRLWVVTRDGFVRLVPKSSFWSWSVKPSQRTESFDEREAEAVLLSAEEVERYTTMVNARVPQVTIGNVSEDDHRYGTAVYLGELTEDELKY